MQFTITGNSNPALFSVAPAIASDGQVFSQPRVLMAPITDNDAAPIVTPEITPEVTPIVTPPPVVMVPVPTLAPLPPPTCPNATTAGSVVGRLNTTAQIYYAPGQAAPGLFLPGGMAYWVTGLDSTRAYYQIILACQRLWVEVGVMGVNFDSPWFGRALPTNVIGG